MKSNSDDEEDLRIFYSYLKLIINLNNQVICEGLDRDTFKVNIIKIK